jgi:hypothetical protein
MDEANRPIALRLQRVCHDTLPWLISFSLDGTNIKGKAQHYIQTFRCVRCGYLESKRFFGLAGNPGRDQLPSMALIEDKTLLHLSYAQKPGADTAA